MKKTLLITAALLISVFSLQVQACELHDKPGGEAASGSVSES